MTAREALAVLATLDGAGCRAWVGGGWGVDALVGSQTRPHRDLDLAIDGPQERAVLAALGDRGYAVETDQRPARVELRGQDERRVDLHPVWFDASGDGRQAGLDGGWFEYPRGCFVGGSIAGRAVPCLSRDQQLRFHTGYAPRQADLHDLALLRGLRPGRGGARLIIVAGLPGSGKTALALGLERELDAVRLSADDWLLALGLERSAEAARAEIERSQFELAQRLLELGTVVIVEWGTWSRAEREALRKRARALGAAVELRFLDAEPDELWRRVRDREPLGELSLEDLTAWAAMIERPTEAELALYDPPVRPR
jgi:lincosamide nucleotidyltransferase A/C/D/E